jgi:hypothetical protein
MLKDDKLVFGWTFMIAAKRPDQALPVVIKILEQIADGSYVPPEQVPDAADPGELQEDWDLQSPDQPPPRGAVPEADAKGNPIVPREARVEVQPMAGLPKNYDRGAPDEKARGVWSIESRKGAAFRPPILKR